MSDGKYDRSGDGILEKYHKRTENRKRKILIIDDEKISCSVLRRILEDRYDILTAGNGQEALEIMNEQKYEISLILLDLMMPVMDGYEFLDYIMKDAQFSVIPVIVTTSRDQDEDEIRCLEHGAVDFVSKPYHPEVVRKRVDRIIHLRETAAILNVVEHDRLTGLYSKESFYLKAEQLLEKNPEQSYDMIVADVNGFKVINERLGMKLGDKVLCYMADRYRKVLGENGICTRLHGDVFAMMVVHGVKDMERELLWKWDEPVEGIPLRTIDIKYGIYENVNHEVPPFVMCDRAMLALSRIKKLYGRHISRYDDSLRAHLVREQQILDTMEEALEEHQFEVYYQPKYNMEDENVSGAEALVRWFQPQFGFMSPGEFIPLFEKNGFITKLDFYIWEETCKNLKKWKTEGRRPIPVSVNISQMDFAVLDLAEKITSLVDAYGIDRELLHLEITETVYTQDREHITQTVNQLRQNGFKIEMDDFGTGYSSLNVLSELSIDVLKLDMKFIQKHADNRRSLLGFVISLSKWLNLETIAEGVETKEQVEQLKSFGCDYVQGYYYAKPMPKEAFERCLEKDVYKVRTEKKNLADASEQLDMEEKKDTVLIVEDNEMNREILRNMVSPYYHVKEAGNGQEAYDYLMMNSTEISVILLDMLMPVMDGFTFMKKKNQNKEFSEIPVIITSESDENSELKALQMGADRFVGKPYHQELLLLSIQATLRKRKKTTNVEENL